MTVLRLFLKLAVFWLAVFLVHHLIFLAFNANSLVPFHWNDCWKSILFGLIMDTSVISFFVMSYIVIFLLSLPFRSSVFRMIMHTWNVLLLILSTIIMVADIGLYQAWGTKINAKAISYVLYPEMMADAAASANYMVLIPLMLILGALGIWLYLKIFSKAYPAHHLSLPGIIVSILLIPLLVIGARGGVRKFPLGKSRVFFSDNFTWNYAALNSNWNFLENLLSLKENTSNPYRFLSDQEAEAIVAPYFMKEETPDSLRLFNCHSPNIVIILLESMSADNLKKLGGIGTAPGLDDLCDSALSFSRFYANGHRSEHGLVALFSGFPPLPTYSLQRESNRIAQLPVMPKILKDSLSYSLNFYNTIDLEYARMNEYLALARFDKILGEADFKEARQHQWGAYDEYLFDRALKEMRSDQEPFFTMILSSVAHEPFKADVPRHFKGNDPADLYKNCTRYTDSCMTDFLEKAHKEPWFDHTVFLILADHGHPFPLNRKHQDPEMYHVPFVIYGGALKKEFRGKTIDLPCSQKDIPAFLLAQLDIPADKFQFSRNIFRSTGKNFGFFTFDDCFGMITDHDAFTYHLELHKVIHSTRGSPDSLSVRTGKAFLQVLYQAFANLN
ncbi:MAG: hypothetical protein FJY10_04610 [Bacteroidetes bacterium]|nr:hypothetical protein [Bacteroidota bacterium]